MEALHRRPAAPTRRRPRLLAAFAAPASALAVGAALTVLGLGSARVGAVSGEASTPRGTAAPRPLPAASLGPDAVAPARRWPAEIEQLLSSMPRADDLPGGDAPTVETDQRCSRVDDGLAHCVMLECQTADGHTACFEMVVTARRLHAPPGSMREGGGESDDEGMDGPWVAPSLMDTQRVDPAPRATWTRPPSPL
jgi:hypothetical protein